jgi:hypothetical protein
MRIRLAPRAERAVTEQAMTGDVPAELRILHTADLDAAMRLAIRGLMDAAFDSVSDDTSARIGAAGPRQRADLRLAPGLALVGAGQVIRQFRLHQRCGCIWAIPLA